MRLLPTTLAAQIYLNIVSFLHLLPLPFFFPFFKQRRGGAQRERGNKVAAADTQRCQALLIETSRSLPDKQREKEKRRKKREPENSRDSGGLAVQLRSLARCLVFACVHMRVCRREVFKASPCRQTVLESPRSLPLVSLLLRCGRLPPPTLLYSS